MAKERSARQTTTPLMKQSRFNSAKIARNLCTLELGRLKLALSNFIAAHSIVCLLQRTEWLNASTLPSGFEIYYLFRNDANKFSFDSLRQCEC